MVSGYPQRRQSSKGERVFLRCTTLLLLGQLALQPLQAQAQPTAPSPDPRNAPAGPTEIHWAIFDAPGYFSASSGQTIVSKTSNKVGDRLLALIIDAMKGTKASVQVMPIARIVKEIAAHQRLCFFAASLNPERKKIGVWTQISLAPAVMIVVRTELAEAHPDWRAGVRLRDIIAIPTMSGQYSALSALGEEVDAIINSLPQSNLKANALARPISDFRMVIERRIDYALDYPDDLEEGIKSGAIPKDALTVIPLLDVPRSNSDYALCPRDEWGIGAIQAIDRAMQEVAKDPVFEATLREAVPPGLQGILAKDIDAFVKMRAGSSWEQEAR